MSAEAVELKNAVGGPITDAVADWLAPQYALAARERLATATGAERLQILRTFVQDWALLRRGDHSAERLRIEREQLNLNRELSKERMEKLFWEWAAKPENKSRICFRRDPGKPRGGLSAETLKAIEERLKLL